MKNGDKVVILGYEFKINSEEGRNFLINTTVGNGYAVYKLVSTPVSISYLFGAFRGIDKGISTCPEFASLTSFMAFVNCLRSLEQLKRMNGWTP